jgi:hypothetical protein
LDEIFTMIALFACAVFTALANATGLTIIAMGGILLMGLAIITYIPWLSLALLK